MPRWLKGSAADINIPHLMKDSQVLCEDSVPIHLCWAQQGPSFSTLYLKTLCVGGFLPYCYITHATLIMQQPASVILILFKFSFRLFNQVHA